MARLRTLGSRIGTLDPRTTKPPSKQPNPLYSTPEYRRWRAAVVERAGHRCQGKGCDYSGGVLYADHIVEIQDGGAEFDLTNGQALCPSCHTKKTHAARDARQAKKW